MWASGKIVRWFDVVSDADQSGVVPTGELVGEVWVAMNWGAGPGAVADGHFAQWDGATWVDEGAVEDGVHIVVNGSSYHGVSGSFAGHDRQILRYDYDPESRDYSGKRWVRVDSNATIKTVCPQQSPYSERTWMWTVQEGSWRPLADGDAPLRFFAQDDLPDIGKGEAAIWKDTNDGNKVYLIFNNGGTVVGVEMTAFIIA